MASKSSGIKKMVLEDIAKSVAHNSNDIGVCGAFKAFKLSKNNILFR